MSALNELKQKALAYYQSRTDSEQKLLAALGLLFVVFIVVSTVRGLNSSHQEASKKLQQQQELNGWVAEQIELINSRTSIVGSGSGSANNNNASLTQIVNSTARRHQVTLARIQPQSTHMVKLGLDEVNFNQLMTWLAELRNSHGVVVNNIDISKAKDSGLVKVRRLDLERK